MFCLIFYDYDYPKDVSQSLSVFKTKIWFPLFAEIIILMLKGIFQFLWAFMWIIGFHLIIALFLLLYA